MARKRQRGKHRGGSPHHSGLNLKDMKSENLALYISLHKDLDKIFTSMLQKLDSLLKPLWVLLGLSSALVALLVYLVVNLARLLD